MSSVRRFGIWQSMQLVWAVWRPEETFAANEVLWHWRQTALYRSMASLPCWTSWGSWQVVHLSAPLLFKKHCEARIRETALAVSKRVSLFGPGASSNASANDASGSPGR